MIFLPLCWSLRDLKEGEEDRSDLLEDMSGKGYEGSRLTN